MHTRICRSCFHSCITPQPTSNSQREPHGTEMFSTNQSCFCLVMYVRKKCISHPSTTMRVLRACTREACDPWQWVFLCKESVQEQKEVWQLRRRPRYWLPTEGLIDGDTGEGAGCWEGMIPPYRMLGCYIPDTVFTVRQSGNFHGGTRSGRSAPFLSLAVVKYSWGIPGFRGFI